MPVQTRNQMRSNNAVQHSVFNATQRVARTTRAHAVVASGSSLTLEPLSVARAGTGIGTGSSSEPHDSPQWSGSLRGCLKASGFTSIII
jgi:hypothetical protein